MCLALYLAASQELPVIAWDKRNPAFHVIRLPKEADAVRKHFRSDYVYYAGSAQGCSCAFNYEHESDSIVDLKNFLRNAMICVSEVEMFACQAGSEGQETQAMRCGVCGAQLTRTRTDLPFKVRDTGIVILKGLPVLQCTHCPQYLIEDAVLAQVDQILARVTDGTELEIVRYAA
jgi:YgiT-type zinc finger domain-containing protein